MSEPETPEPSLDETSPDAPSTDDAAAAARAKAVRMTQIGLVVAVVLIVGIVLLTRGGDDDRADGGAKGDGTEQADGTDAPSGKPQWPASLGGRPPALGVRDQPATDVQVGAGTAPGVYLWNDYDGWHLWVVGGGPDLVRGTLTSNDPVAKAELAVPGAGTVAIDDKVVTFELPGAAGLSGIDFNPGFFAKQLVFTLEGPNGPLDSSVVFVGSKAAEAPFPLVFEKEVQG